jgi:ParB-like chromosome segregation protein Spo0J
VIRELEISYRATAELRTYYHNPRKGNTRAIAESLQVNSQYRPIVVNAGTHTGRPDEVLAGNHTLMAARDLGWEHIAVVTVDVDDDQAARIVAADNRTADLAEYDDRLLVELLEALPTLDGTGYDPGDLDQIVSRILVEDGQAETPDGLWDGMPEFAQGDERSVFRCIVHFASEEDATAFFALIERPRKPIFWWPKDIKRGERDNWSFRWSSENDGDGDGE